MSILRPDQHYFESVSAITATNSVELGTRRLVAGNEYVYCYNGGGASITSGYGVTVSGTSGYTVTVSSVTQVNHIVGYAPYTFATATYGWIQVQGFAQIVMGSVNSAAVSDPLRAGTDGRFAVNSVATGYIDIPCGFALEAMASGASGKAYLRTVFA